MQRIIVLLALALLILTACGGEEEGDTTPVAQATSTTAAEPSEAEATDMPPATAAVEATDAPAETPTVTATEATSEATMTPSPEATEMATDTAGATVNVGLELVAEGLTAPVGLVPMPGDSGRLVVLDQIGVVYILDETGVMMDEPFLDVRDRMVELSPDYDERGLLGMAFHPDYSENGRVFVYYSAPLREGAPAGWNHTARISEFAIAADNADTVNMGSEQVLLEVDEPQMNHDGGTILFGPDGYLYIALGDGGEADDVGEGHVEDWYEVNEGGNGQDLASNLLGSILRIDVDGEPTGERAYGIPADNPFANIAGAEEVWAIGFRNPYRMSFDMGGDNELFVGDVGQNRWEEVSIVAAGGNYGWNVKEGTHCFSAADPSADLEECPDEDADGRALEDPIIEFQNSNVPGGVGLVVIGGYVYRGQVMPGWEGNYIFGSWSTGWDAGNGALFVATPAAGQGELWPMQELSISNNESGRIGSFLLAIGQDNDGELYALTSDSLGPSGTTGRVYRIVPAE